MTIGIAMIQLFRIEKRETRTEINEVLIKLEDRQDLLYYYGKYIGCFFIILGIITLLTGAFRFFFVQRMLVLNHFPATRKSLVTIIVLILVALIATLALILRVFF